MLLKALVVLSLIVSCGKGDSPDCPSCPSNPSQPTPPTPPTPEPPPEESDKTLTCDFVWELSGAPEDRHFKIHYKVIYKKTKETYAFLKSSYHIGEDVVEGSEASKTYKPEEKNAAEVSTFVWQASMKDGKALIKNHALNETREASCI